MIQAVKKNKSKTKSKRKLEKYYLILLFYLSTLSLNKI